MSYYFFAEKMWVAFAFAKATHIFLAKNNSAYAICKSYSHFFSKITCEFDIVLIRTVHILTTNELVKLTTLWTTGPRSRRSKGGLHAGSRDYDTRSCVTAMPDRLGWRTSNRDDQMHVSVCSVVLSVDLWQSPSQIMSSPTPLCPVIATPWPSVKSTLQKRHYEVFCFLIFSQKTGFDISCKLSPLEMSNPIIWGKYENYHWFVVC